MDICVRRAGYISRELRMLLKSQMILTSVVLMPESLPCATESFLGIRGCGRGFLSHPEQGGKASGWLLWGLC